MRASSPTPYYPDPRATDPDQIARGARREGHDPHAALLVQVIEELRALRREVDRDRSSFLNFIPPKMILPVVRTGIADYVNVAGTERVLLDIGIGAGKGFIVTSLEPLFFTSSADQLSRISNPYAMLVDTSNQRVPHRFDISVDGGSVGDLSTQVVNTAGAWETGAGGPLAATDIIDELGWRSGFYAAFVRGGGRIVVRSQVLGALGAGAGNTIPSYVGMRVAGFTAPEGALKEIYGG